jgi:hypothetical protein
MSVKVLKSEKTGKVIIVSRQNEKEGSIRVWDIDNGRFGFLRSSIEILNELDLGSEFKRLAADGVNTKGIVPLQPKGFAAGQELPGKIVIIDQLKPVIPANLDYCKRIPINIHGKKEFNSIIHQACKKARISYMVGGQPIYRKEFYHPYPAGHPKYEADILLEPDNIDEITSFIHTIDNVSIVSHSKKEDSNRFNEKVQNYRIDDEIVNMEFDWETGGVRFIHRSESNQHVQDYLDYVDFYGID